MHKTKLVIFDLDGTLIDSSKIISESYKETLAQIGISTEIQEFNQFIGRNLFSVFRNDFNLELAEALRATSIHRTISHCKTIRLKDMSSILYPGVEYTVSKLRDSGIECGIATLKNEDVAKYIISRCGLLDLFSAGILGMSPEEQDCKSNMIDSMLRETNTERKSCIMVGDHSSDAYAAIKSGVRFLPVSYGYGLRNTDCFKMSSIKELLTFV